MMNIPKTPVPFSNSTIRHYFKNSLAGLTSSVRWLIAVVLITTQMQAVVAQNNTTSTEVESNRMVEVLFAATDSYKDPFNEVTLDVIFKTPGGHELKVPAFWAGGNNWKVRYSSAETGQHTYQSVCSNPRDAGLNKQAGTIKVKKYSGTNELYQHGATIGTFQFESPGMQKYLRELKPDKFGDLIAMNALYRPGPIAYIPTSCDLMLGVGYKAQYTEHPVWIGM